MPPFVSLVGAGPWDPELLTLAALDRVSHAEVLIVDYLVNPAVLLHCRPDAEIIARSSGPHHRGDDFLDQDQVNALMVDRALAGKYVVRLKGGDPMMFGRGAEEANYLRQHQIEFEFIPGVSSPIAAPECAGIPITHRHHTPSVSFVSGYEAYDKAGLQVAWKHLAQSAGTLVLMMSVKNCGQNAERLIEAGRSPDTPAALIRWGTRGIQQTVRGTLQNIAHVAEKAHIRPPAVLVVGNVVNLRDQIQWVESRPLFGRRVVLTRTMPQSKKLVRLLAANGAEAVVCPCLEIIPPQNPSAIDQCLSNLHNYDGIILSSSHGVDAFVTTLRNRGQDIRSLAGLTIACIGAGTSEAARSHGIIADIVPDEAHSEGLVSTLRSRQQLQRRWLHLRAEEGRDILADAIRDAQGSIDVIIAYRSVRPKVPKLILQSLAPIDHGGEGFDAICFTSGKTARHFTQTLDEFMGEPLAREQISKAKVIAIGPVTAKALVELNIRVDHIAKQPNDKGIMQEIWTALADPCRQNPPLRHLPYKSVEGNSG